MKAPPLPSAALTQVQAAAFLGVSVRAFRDLVERDSGVARSRRYPTSRPVYVREVLAKWLDGKHGTGCPTTKGRVSA